MPASALHARTSSLTKCRRLSSRRLPSLTKASWFCVPWTAAGPRPARCTSSARTFRPARDAPTAHLMERAVAQVVQRRRRRAAGRCLGHHVEVFVVALDPVEGRGRCEVLAVIARDVAHLQPERHIRVPAHDLLDGVELAVDVAEGADRHDLREVTRTGQAGQASLARQAGRVQGQWRRATVVFRK